MRIEAGGKVLVTETSLERALLRLEIAHENRATFYVHADGSAVDMLEKDESGQWGHEPTVLKVVDD